MNFHIQNYVFIFFLNIIKFLKIPELTLDDWSGYIDEGDFMKIPGISAEYFTEKAKNQSNYKIYMFNKHNLILYKNISILLYSNQLFSYNCTKGDSNEK